MPPCQHSAGEIRVRVRTFFRNRDDPDILSRAFSKAIFVFLNDSWAHLRASAKWSRSILPGKTTPLISVFPARVISAHG